MDKPAGSRLFIVCGHICEEDTLRQACSRFGPVTSVRCLREKGVAFVKFSTASEAARALEALNGATLKEGQVNVQLKVMLADPADNGRSSAVDSPAGEPCAQDPDNVPARSRLFLVVPRDADVHRIKQAMEAYEGMQYFRDEFAASKGVLYVKYNSASSALKALEDIQAANCNLAGYRVKAMLADPKSSSRTTSAADDHGSHRGRWASGNGSLPLCRPASTGMSSQKHGPGTDSPNWRPPFHELHSVPDPFLDLRCNSAPGPTPYPPPFLTTTPHPPHHPGSAPMGHMTQPVHVTQPPSYAPLASMRTSSSSGLGKYATTSCAPPALPHVPSQTSGDLRWDAQHRTASERAPSLGGGGVRVSVDAPRHPGHAGMTEAQRPDKVMRVASVGASSEGPLGPRSAAAYAGSERYASAAPGGVGAVQVYGGGGRGDEGLHGSAEGRYRQAVSSSVNGAVPESDSSPEAEAIQNLQHALHQHYDSGYPSAQAPGLQAWSTWSSGRCCRASW